MNDKTKRKATDNGRTDADDRDDQDGRKDESADGGDLLDKLENETPPDALSVPWEPDVGDKLLGRVVDLSERRDNFGNEKQTATVKGKWIQDGEVAYEGEITVWANWTVLADLFKRKSPNVGDRIAVERLENRDGQNHEYQMFKMAVEREGQDVQQDDDEQEKPLSRGGKNLPF